MTTNTPPRYWLPIALWVVWGMIRGDGGYFLCPECGNEATCFGCIVAYRRINGKVEYWKEPKHGYAA